MLGRDLCGGIEDVLGQGADGGCRNDKIFACRKDLMRAVSSRALLEDADIPMGLISEFERKLTGVKTAIFAGIADVIRREIGR